MNHHLYTFSIQFTREDRKTVSGMAFGRALEEIFVAGVSLDPLKAAPPPMGRKGEPKPEKRVPSAVPCLPEPFSSKHLQAIYACRRPVSKRPRESRSPCQGNSRHRVPITGSYDLNDPCVDLCPSGVVEFLEHFLFILPSHPGHCGFVSVFERRGV